MQAAVSRQAYERERRLQAGADKKVGVNCYERKEEEPDIAFHPYRQEEAGRQLARLERVRAERDADVVRAALERLRADAAAHRNVMPAAIDAVEAYATVGEVCGVLKDVFGTYKEPIRF